MFFQGKMKLQLIIYLLNFLVLVYSLQSSLMDTYYYGCSLHNREKLTGTDWALVSTNDGKKYYYNTKNQVILYVVNLN
jgi:hypothetical protein